MKVLVIGAGNMGLTYAMSMAKSNLLKKGDLLVMDAAPEKVEELKKQDDFVVYDDVGACIEMADMILIAVKPYHSADLFSTIRHQVREDQIFVSLMAGVKIKTIQEALGAKKVVRTMPNLPALVQKGMTSFTCTESVSDEERKKVRALLSTTGQAFYVKDEKSIDATTGISGSGPAYVFYFMQSMMEAAHDLGFDQEEAKTLVQSTFEGALELFRLNDLSPAEWMDKVASKGGTTEAALGTLERNKVKNRIKKAAIAAFDRAEEIGRN